MQAKPKTPPPNASKTPIQVLLALCALAGLIWVFLPTLADLASRWGSESQYSHGFVVPVFAGVLLWLRRRKLPKKLGKPNFWGLVLLVAGLGLRFLGTYIYFDWLSAVSLLPCLAGVCLLAGGWKTLRWAWPAIAFLIFMVPLPHRLEGELALPLRGIATRASTFLLQTIGFAAFAEGHVIRMGEIRIGVVEACSGLSMLLIFFALSTAVVLLTQRTVLEKGVILLSAIPIALIANVTRIFATGIVHRTIGSEWAEYVFHDLAGWLMPLLALGLLWVELRLLSLGYCQPPRAITANFRPGGRERCKTSSQAPGSRQGGRQQQRECNPHTCRKVSPANATTFASLPATRAINGQQLPRLCEFSCYPLRLSPSSASAFGKAFGRTVGPGRTSPNRRRPSYPPCP
jgi:exosortase